MWCGVSHPTCASGGKWIQEGLLQLLTHADAVKYQPQFCLSSTIWNNLEHRNLGPIDQRTRKDGRRQGHNVQTDAANLKLCGFLTTIPKGTLAVPSCFPPGKAEIRSSGSKLLGL